MKQNNFNPNSEKSAIGVLIVLATEATRRYFRSKGQRKLQNKVTDYVHTVKPKKSDDPIKDLEFTLCNLSENQLNRFTEIKLDESEVRSWKAFISSIGGGLSELVLDTWAFNGLLKCDVPIKDLYKLKDNPSLLRGIVFKDGKIDKNAVFTEVGSKEMTPLFLYQCMAAVTSQYYQQIIAEQLNNISSKLDNILKILTAEDSAKLEVSYKRFKELNQKTTYDIADKQIVSECSGYVEIIRSKYRKLLSGINNLNVQSEWIDKKEAEKKIRALNNSNYLEYLDFAMQAEILCYLANMVSIKIAHYLGNFEDVHIYNTRLNLNFWDNYVTQFNLIKNDVIKYLELEAESSFFQGKDIYQMRDLQLKRFNDFETSMLSMQDRLNLNVIQYIRINPDGSAVKYIPSQLEN